MSGKESSNNYKPKDNPNSSATGKYQHLWDIHSIKIGEVTGVKTREEYLNNPAAQEKYQEHLVKQYQANIPKLRERYNLSEDVVADETIMMMQHYLGSGDINVYLKELMSTGDYDAAQEALDKSILTRLQKKNPKAVLPKNTPVVEYLADFVEKLNNLPSENVVTQPSTPKPTPPVRKSTVVENKPTVTYNPNPTFSAPNPYEKSNKTEPTRTLTREEIAKEIENKYKIKPTKEQLDIVANPNISAQEKMNQLGLMPKIYSGPQNVSNPSRIEEMWETLINEGVGALFSQTTSAATSPNEGLEQKVTPITDSTSNKNQEAKTQEIKKEEEEPTKVTLGSRIENYGGNSDRYIEPFKINTKSAKFGVRSRGETQDIATEGAVFTTFKPWTYASSPEYVNEFNYYLVVDKASGNLKIASNPKQDKNSLLNKQSVRGNPEMVTTGTYGRLAESLNLNGAYNDGIDSKTMGYINQDGNQASLPTFGIGKDGSELGGYKGGKLILSNPDGSDPIIVYGSAQIVINEFNKYKKKHNLKNVLVLDADGKSYAQSYQTKSKVIKGSDLRSNSWDNANTASAGSGNILYLK